uniref:Uncharacterized protein n=1 Tax=Glossina morsitans morsitans TaxID=37546 RepID=A0A1B0FE42_GLOMM
MKPSLPFAHSTQINHKCRTCTKGKISRYSLYQRVSQDNGLSKTYGELISNLLGINPSEEEEFFMPQRLCIKCANLLEDIYVFLIEAEKLQEIYLNQARNLKNVKNEDCLQELPIDLPQAPETSVDVQTEPPETIMGVGAEPHLFKSLSNFDDPTKEAKEEPLTENVKKEINQSDECSLNDVILQLGNLEDSKSGLQENARQDSSHEICEEPIDLPLEAEININIKTETPEIIVDIKTEPSETIVGIGTEPQLSNSLSSFDDLTGEAKQELLTENVKKEINQRDECSLNDVILQLGNEEDAKSGLQENAKQDCSREVFEGQRRHPISTDEVYNKEIINNKAKLQRNLSETCDVRCDICCKIYKNPRGLSAHKFHTHMTDEEKLPCALCAFKTSRLACLKNHITSKHGHESTKRYIKPKNEHIRSYACYFCSSKYSRKDNLQTHIREKHAQHSKQKVENQTEERPHKCELCGKAFKTRRNMKMHRLIHSDEKPHQCPECGKSFRRSDKLRDHRRRVHSELRPYKCTECDKSFKYASVLRAHRHMHSDQKPSSGQKPPSRQKPPSVQKPPSSRKRCSGQKSFSGKICKESFQPSTSANARCLKNGRNK